MTHVTGTGIFGRALDALVRARSRQAEHYLNGALLMLDDKTLAGIGRSRAELLKRPHTSALL